MRATPSELQSACYMRGTWRQRLFCRSLHLPHLRLPLRRTPPLAHHLSTPIGRRTSGRMPKPSHGPARTPGQPSYQCYQCTRPQPHTPLPSEMPTLGAAQRLAAPRASRRRPSSSPTPHPIRPHANRAPPFLLQPSPHPHIPLVWCSFLERGAPWRTARTMPGALRYHQEQP